MRRITLLILLSLSIFSYSTRYLVQGSGASSWRTALSGEVNITLSTSLNSWYSSNSATFVSGTDEIWLTGGTYVTDGTITLKNGVNLYGSFAGTETSVSERSKVSGGKSWEFTSPTVIDGNNANRQGLITSNSAPVTYIDGLTITKYNIVGAAANVTGVGALISTNWILQNSVVSYNTFTNSTDKQCRGAGVYVKGGQLLNSYIHHNEATKGTGTGSTYGGGIAFVYNSSPVTTVKGCTIESNVSTVVGGGMAILDGTGGTLEDCIFKYNINTNGSGGGIGTSSTTAANGSLSIKNCQFIENTASTGNGGGAHLDMSITSPATTSIEGCLFIGNSALTQGGALNVNAGIFSVIKNCIFRDNKITNAANTTNATSALYYGAAAANNTTVSNCVFVNNSTTTNTSGNNTIKFLNANNNLYNCTIANNANPGGYALAYNGTIATMSNCIFWGNTGAGPYQGISTGVVTTYNATDNFDMFGKTYSNNIKSLTIIPNNTFTSPTTFAGAPTDATQKAASAAADWSLKTGCPAINTGTDLAASGVTTDILGNTRPTGASVVDRGAYEVLNVADYADGSNVDVSGSGHLTINTTKTLGNITVAAGGKLSVASGQTLTLTNLTLKSNASGTSTFVNDGTLTLTGTAAVEQYLATTRNWYVSSPVSNANAPTGYTYYRRYEPGGTETGWTTVSSGTGLIAGIGYIALPSTPDAPITFTTQGGGTLNNGNITIPLTYTPLATSGKGYNLIGNPYPAHLTWTKTFVDNNSSLIEPTIYYRTNAGSVNSGGDAAWSFKTYNASTNEFSPAGTTNIIPPMQAFWVKAKAIGNLILNSDLTKSHQTSNPLKAPAMNTASRQRVRLQVTGGTRTDETVLLFDANASDGYDVFDSPKFAEANSEVQIFTTVGTEKMVMNGMKDMPLNEEIALGFIPGSAINFSLKANEISNLPNDVRVILKDNISSVETDLTDGLTSYQFTMDVTLINRFSLIFRTPGVTTDILKSDKLNAQVFVNAANQITIIAPEKSKYAIYNAVGQLIENGVLNTKRETRNTKLNSGVYVVKVNNQTTRVIIK